MKKSDTFTLVPWPPQEDICGPRAEEPVRKVSPSKMSPPRDGFDPARTIALASFFPLTDSVSAKKSSHCSASTGQRNSWHAWCPISGIVGPTVASYTNVAFRPEALCNRECLHGRGRPLGFIPIS